MMVTPTGTPTTMNIRTTRTLAGTLLLALILFWVDNDCRSSSSSSSLVVVVVVEAFLSPPPAVVQRRHPSTCSSASRALVRNSGNGLLQVSSSRAHSHDAHFRHAVPSVSADNDGNECDDDDSNAMILESSSSSSSFSRRSFFKTALVGTATAATAITMTISSTPEPAQAALATTTASTAETQLDESISLQTNHLSLASSSASSSLTATTTARTSTTESTTSTTTTTVDNTNLDWQAIVQKASKKALGGGKAGAAAAVVQVSSLMWLRTAMNYQYRYGGNLTSSLSTLYADGGIPRLYQGLPFALVQGPATRFFDTAANVGILALLDSVPAAALLPLPVKTGLGSIAAGASRILLMPVDTAKTTMQVEGADGLKRLWAQVVGDGGLGPAPLYRGALASAAATAAGHFPWFLTYNALNANLPTVSSVLSPDDQHYLLWSLARSALLGLSASCVSDCVSNSLRVLKTTKQTAGLSSISSSHDESTTTNTTTTTATEVTYGEALAMVLEQDGIMGLLGRGLQTRLLTNMIQGAVFSVLWKYFQTVGGAQ